MSQPNMIKATVGILTFNSSKYLNNCLNSVKNFDEILIIDGGSKDETLSIAKKHKCKIKKQPNRFKFKNNKIKDFSKLRNYILKLAKNDLVLFLDSDEILNKSALKKIDYYSQSQISKKKYYSFLLGRFPIHKNKIITQKTIFYPNYQDRLFYKSNIKKFIKPVHEKAIPKSKNLLRKKIQNQTINFPIIQGEESIYKKLEYYYEIEKNMVSRKKIFSSMRFVFFRILVLLKYFFGDLIFNSKNVDVDFRNFEKKLLKISIFFSLKLFFKIFK